MKNRKEPLVRKLPQKKFSFRNFFNSVFSTIGKIFVFYIFVTSISTFYWRFIRTADWSEYNGEWAMITGSSYGIGSEFALGLAKRGVNVVIAARTKHKLEELKKEINQKYPKVEVKILVMDVLKDGWEKSLEEIKDMKISILVNNVGGNTIGNGTLLYYHEYPYQEIEDLHKLNLFSFQRMIYEIIPKMISQKKGRIINVSSLSVIFSYKLSVYPGDKAFMNTFTEQLNEEYLKFGIRSEALIVGHVSTPAQANVDVDGFITCSSKALAESALDLWGWNEVYSPYWAHAFVLWLNQNSILRYAFTQSAKGVVETHFSGLMQKSRGIIGKIHEKEKGQNEL